MPNTIQQRLSQSIKDLQTLNELLTEIYDNFHTNNLPLGAVIHYMQVAVDFLENNVKDLSTRLKLIQG